MKRKLVALLIYFMMAFCVCEIASASSSTINFTKVTKKVTAALYGHDDIKVSWNKVSGATGYNVYYKKSNSDTYKLLTSTKNKSVKKANLADGTNYTFKVVAYKTVNKKKVESTASKTVTIDTLKV